MPSRRSSRLIRAGSTACTPAPRPTRSCTRAGTAVPDLVRDLVALGVRMHAVEPARISLEERLLGILRAGAEAGDHAGAGDRP